MKGMTKLQANICLLCVTMCWSTEVIIFACIPKSVPGFATTCITSAIGAAILIASFYKRIAEALRRNGRKLLLICLFLGVMNTAYNTMYIYGLKDFDVSTGAFTLSMTVVVLPVILLTLRQRVKLQTWLSAALVLIGVTLSVMGNIHLGQITGFMLILFGCLTRAVYIVSVNRFAREYDPLAISAFMTLIVAVLSFVMWYIVDTRTFAAIDWTRQVTASLFIYSYFIVAFAQTINFFAQRRTTAASATVIYSLEIVFSVIWGVVLPANIIDPVNLTVNTVIGMTFVVAGSLMELVDFKALFKKGAAASEG